MWITLYMISPLAPFERIAVALSVILVFDRRLRTYVLCDQLLLSLIGARPWILFCTAGNPYLCLIFALFHCLFATSFGWFICGWGPSFFGIFLCWSCLVVWMLICALYNPLLLVNSTLKGKFSFCFINSVHNVIINWFDLTFVIGLSLKLHYIKIFCLAACTWHAILDIY